MSSNCQKEEGWSQQWPICLRSAKSVNFNPKKVVKYIKGMSLKTDLNKIIKIERCLGSHTTEKFTDCPNMPQGHLDTWEEEGDWYLEDLGGYRWIDVLVIDAQATETAIRLVFNEGCADMNDGIWGAGYLRENGNRIIDIKSVGDCISSIKRSGCYKGFKEYKQDLVSDEYASQRQFFEFDLIGADQLSKLLAVAISGFFDSLVHQK